MATLKSFTIAAALLVAGTSLAVAQNGPATAGEPPVGGGAGGNPANMGPSGPGAYRGSWCGARGRGRRLHVRTRGVVRDYEHMYQSTRGRPHKRLETRQPQVPLDLVIGLGAIRGFLHSLDACFLLSKSHACPYVNVSVRTGFLFLVWRHYFDRTGRRSQL
jgi:hypothetical protein